MKRKFILIISLNVIITIAGSTFRLCAQPVRESSLSTNLVGLPFGDYSLYYEITKVDTSKFGFSFGYLIANRWLAEAGFEVNDAWTPILAYNGPQLRLYYLFSCNKKKQKKYFGLELFGKYLHYKNTTFTDYIDAGEMEPVGFTRNEKAIVTGAEFRFCKDYCAKSFFSQIFFGAGFRVKMRDINTIKTFSQGYDFFRPVGHTYETNWFPMVNFGFKIGRLLRT